MNNNKVEISMTDIYQLLISAGRYAYTRNNHLEPHYFYNQVKRITLDMFKVDENETLDTLKQLVEECINKELCTFIEEDIYGNKLATIEFINWGIEQINNHGSCWSPYNIDLFEKYK